MGVFDFFKTSEIAEIKQNVSSSFAKVKQDTDALHQWISYLYGQNQQLVEQNSVFRRLVDEQKLALNELRVNLAHVPKTPNEIKRIVDTHYNLDPILQRIKHIERKIELLELRRERPQPVLSRPLEHQPVSVSAESVSPEKKSTALREKMMRKLARNSKDYIKNMVLGLMHKYGKMAALQLREIIVEEQGLCSKSSFYRILEEMKAEDSLQIVSSGKHVVYVAVTQN